MKYYVFYQGPLNDSGCGWYIGCNQRIEEYATREEADAAVRAFIEGRTCWLDPREYREDAFDNVAFVRVLEVTAETPVDLDTPMRQWRALADKVKEDKDRREYERLKERFGPP